jgi:hypothetical protein
MHVRIVAGLCALALAGTIAITGCSGSAQSLTPGVQQHSAAAYAKKRTPSSTPAAVTSAPTPAAAASPAGAWTVAYSSAPAQILGQYSITEDGGFYYMTTKTVLKVPDGNCSLPADTGIGVFSAAGGTGTFTGTENLYESGTCAPSTSPATAALTVTISGNTMLLLVPGQQSVTLTRAGSAPVAASAPPPAALSSSPASCLVPDLLDDPLATANSYVRSAGFRSVVDTAKTFPGNNSTSPGNFPAGQIWGTNPPETTRAPCGSTVTVYYQPSSPSPSTAGCIVPDVIGAGLNGHIAAAAAENKVANTCPPVGYHVVTVLTVSGPAGTPPGELWKESPPAGSSEPAGSTVTLYFQP